MTGAAISAAGVVLAAILGFAGNGWWQRRKTDAEADSIGATATKTLGESYVALIEQLRTEVDRQSTRIAELEANEARQDAEIADLQQRLAVSETERNVARAELDRLCQNQLHDPED